uniref:Uncharacterized protein n=1 Tax=Romanomermis culicivorax TaxID=13658 RepID=A0A915J3R9_ROMCU
MPEPKAWEIIYDLSMSSSDLEISYQGASLLPKKLIRISGLQEMTNPLAICGLIILLASCDILETR